MRPQLHFTPPKNWCNDPNGLCYFNGEYHLFYQYFPYDTSWGTMHWAHATTKDFITYQHHDIAIYPSNIHDQNGVFSGSAFIENNQMNLYYTGVKYCNVDPVNVHIPLPQNNFLSSQLKLTSHDGYQFHMNDKELILPISDDEMVADSVHTRDPKVWKYNGKYYMVLATKLKTGEKEQGKMNVYVSDNLTDFKYFTSYTRSHYGNMWECPDFFAINDQQFAIMSPENFVDNALYPSQATIQKAKLDYQTAEFYFADDYEMIDYGLDLYAPQTFEDENNHRVMIAWLRMPRPLDDIPNKYIGTFTMPRVITYNGTEINYDVHELIKNKFNHNPNSKFSIYDTSLIKTVIKRNQYINIGNYKISYDGKVMIDRTDVFPNQDAAVMYSPAINLDEVYLEIYIDVNVIEIFIDHGRYVISNVVYNLENHLKTNIDNLELYKLN